MRTKPTISLLSAIALLTQVLLVLCVEDIEGRQCLDLLISSLFVEVVYFSVQGPQNLD